MTDTNTIAISEELARIVADNLDLNIKGWRCPDTTSHDEDRAALLDAVDEYRTAKLFLRDAQRCVVERGENSYHLKHVAEDFYDTYIPNGALIAAAIALELTIQRHADNPNCRINIRSKRRRR